MAIEEGAIPKTVSLEPGSPASRSDHNPINRYTPDAELSRLGNLFQSLVLEGSIGQRHRPPLFQQIGAEIFAVIKPGGFYPAPAHDAAVIQLAHYFTADKTIYFEIQCHRCARSTNGG